MVTFSELQEQRSELEQRLERLPLSDKERDRELHVYDIITRAVGDYEDKKKESNKRIDDKRDEVLRKTISRAIMDYHQKLAANGAIPRDDNLLESYLDEMLQHYPDISQRAQLNSAIEKHHKTFAKPPTYILMLNYDPQNPQHAGRIYIHNAKHTRVKILGRNEDTEEIAQSLREKSIFEERVLAPLLKVGYLDGAVVVRPDSKIQDIRAILERIDIDQIPNATALMDGEAEGIPIRNYAHGFVEPVNTRHYNSLGSSHILPGTVIYTKGEEHGEHVRRMQGGKITFSTHEVEDYIAKKVLGLRNGH